MFGNRTFSLKINLLPQNVNIYSFPSHDVPSILFNVCSVIFFNKRCLFLIQKRTRQGKDHDEILNLQKRGKRATTEEKECRRILNILNRSVLHQGNGRIERFEEYSRERYTVAYSAYNEENHFEFC